jgi:hypothetical protein
MMTEPTFLSSQPPGLRWNWWNLLLLVPFLMLVTPWINALEPALFGIPLFYWSQLLAVPVGAVCVAIVSARTRDQRPPVAPGLSQDVDDLDERTAR